MLENLILPLFTVGIHQDGLGIAIHRQQPIVAADADPPARQTDQSVRLRFVRSACPSRWLTGGVAAKSDRGAAARLAAAGRTIPFRRRDWALCLAVRCHQFV